MPSEPCRDIAAVRTMLNIVGVVMWNYFDAKPADYWTPRGS